MSRSTARTLPAASTLLVATLLVSAITSCGGSGSDGNREVTPAPPTASESVGDAPAPSPTVAAAETAAELADGRHPGLIKDLDVAALTMKFDLVEFLTGEAAKKAYLKDFPDDASGPPNDYWVVNANPRLRTLSISPDVVVLIAAYGGPGQMGEMPLEDLPNAFSGYLEDILFWITVSDGKVTKIEQQWVA